MYNVRMIYELRTYEIPNHVRKAFHERFEKHAMPIMKRCGFNVIGVWDEVIGHQQKFHYLTAWKDLNERMDCWDKLNKDEEWAKIKKQYNDKYGELVSQNYTKILKPTSYSPLS